MISLFKPFIPKEAGEAVKKVIDSGMINRGKQAELFERLLKERFGFFQVHTVNSCTSALKLSLKVAGVGKNMEVLSTPWTMIATNTAILEAGAKPVFVDIDYDTFNINPTKLEEKITEKTKAIMVVHYAGYPVDLKEVYKVAHNHDLEVIQDCAHALGSMYRGRYIGSFGRFCCFSFQAIKTMTTGDGGAVSTTDQEVYEEIVRRSWFGIDKRKRKKTLVGSFPEDIDVLGYKNNITDIDATLGIVGLRYLDQALQRRNLIARRYNSSFKNLTKISLPKYAENNVSSYWVYPMHVQNRHSFAKFMEEAEIEVSKHNERNDKYSIFGGIQEELENTGRVDGDIIHIPIHSGLTDQEVNYIIKKVLEWDRSE